MTVHSEMENSFSTVICEDTRVVNVKIGETQKTRMSGYLLFELRYHS